MKIFSAIEKEEILNTVNTEMNSLKSNFHNMIITDALPKSYEPFFNKVFLVYSNSVKSLLDEENPKENKKAVLKQYDILTSLNYYVSKSSGLLTEEQVDSVVNFLERLVYIQKGYDSLYKSLLEE